MDIEIEIKNSSIDIKNKHLIIRLFPWFEIKENQRKKEESFSGYTFSTSMQKPR